MSLYSWDLEKRQITVQVWLQPSPNGFVAAATSPALAAPRTAYDEHHQQLFNRLLASTRDAVKKLEQLQTASTITPLADSGYLLDLWNAVGDANRSVDLVDNEQSSYPASGQNPQCADPTYANDPAHAAECAAYSNPSYDAKYDQEVEQDKNQTNYVNDLTYPVDSSSSNTTAVIVIAVVVPVVSILLFIAVACAIRYCHKNNKACFAKKSKKDATSATAGTAISMTETTSSHSGTSSGNNSGANTKTSQALPASIMPSHPTSTTSSASSDLPSGWQEQTDHATGKTYYMNMETMQSQWERPGTTPTQDASGW